MSQYRKIFPYIGISILVHIFIFNSIIRVKKEIPESTDILIIEKKTNPGNKKNGSGSGSKTDSKSGKNFSPKRIGSDGSGFESLSIEDRVTAENYVERIRQIIEPPWISSVKDRIKLRNKMNYPKIKCTSSIVVLVNNTGFISSVKLLDSCKDDLNFDSIALSLWDRNLPPPPKNLLINNLLEIYWKFAIL